MEYIYIYDNKKNEKLKRERGICFDDVIRAIDDGDILDILPHYNIKQYPNQKILVLEIHEYVYLVPYIEENDKLYLKTVFASRKFTKKYLGD